MISVFKIVSETGIAAGVRRIEAVTAEQAESMLEAVEDQIHNVINLLNNPKVEQSIQKLLESNVSLQKEVEQLHKEQISSLADKILAERKDTDGVFVIARQLPYASGMMKDLAYTLRSKASDIVMVFGSTTGDKPTLTIMLGDDIVARGVDAKAIEGGGGGQKFFATAGGKKPEGMQKAIDTAVEIIMSKLK